MKKEYWHMLQLRLKNMEYQLKKITPVPFSVRCYVKEKIAGGTLSKREREILKHIKAHYLKNPIISCGWRKSGCTWTRFVIFNYFNILNNNADRTLSFDELNEISIHSLESDYTKPFKVGFPILFKTHLPYSRIYDYFYKILYIYRNPLDACVSYYFNEKARNRPFGGFPESEKDRITDIDYFVDFNLPLWAYHYKSTKPKSDAVLCYERMKEDPLREFYTAFNILGFPMDENALKRSIDFSSFDNIKKMGRNLNQLYGNSNRRTFKGEFMRSGKPKEYLVALKVSTIDRARKFLKKNGIYGIEL